VSRSSSKRQRRDIFVETLHQVPGDSIAADTQGALGYQLERAQEKKSAANF